MKTRTMMTIAAALASLASLACDVEPLERPAEGAPPAVRTPVGPIPGAGVQAVLAANPYASDRVALQEGRKLFVWYNCAGCHGGHGGGGMGPSLRDVAWMYGSSDSQIFDSIAEGRAHGMPAWGTKLPEQHIWKLVAYIDSMGTPMEPKPPQ